MSGFSGPMEMLPDDNINASGTVRTTLECVKCSIVLVALLLIMVKQLLELPEPTKSTNTTFVPTGNLCSELFFRPTGSSACRFRMPFFGCVKLGFSFLVLRFLAGPFFTAFALVVFACALIRRKVQQLRWGLL